MAALLYMMRASCRFFCFEPKMQFPDHPMFLAGVSSPPLCTKRDPAGSSRGSVLYVVSTFSHTLLHDYSMTCLYPRRPRPRVSSSSYCSFVPLSYSRSLSLSLDIFPTPCQQFYDGLLYSNVDCLNLREWVANSAPPRCFPLATDFDRC